jgi:aminocarboxymuconate-semialdehyde decarboxylase
VRLLKIWNRFGPTVARAAGKPGRTVRPSSITIDVHSHVAVPEAASFVKPHLDLSSIPLVSFATPDTRALNQQQDADRASRMTQYDERLCDLEEMGVDLQVIKPPPPQCYYTLPIEIADKATRMVNDGLANTLLVTLTGSSHSEPFRYRMARQLPPSSNAV